MAANPALKIDGRRVRGEQTRRRILQRAGDDATIDGLNGLSMAHLGEALDLSKSGVHALFGTKEELQLETIAAARQRFIDVVIIPVWDQPSGLPRLVSLIASWMDYVRRREFPGGCFLTRFSAEFSSHPGRVRDALSTVKAEWLDLLAGELAAAARLGEIVESTDAGQLAFEIDALLVAGNNGMLMGNDGSLDRAEGAISARLDAVRG